MHTGSAAYFDILPFARTAFVLQEGEADGSPIYALDAQRSTGKAIFGSGLLLSDRLAAEHAAVRRAAAERAAATK